MTAIISRKPASQQITENSATILKKRYLLDGETPDDLWDLVSFGNSRYRRLLSELRFLPNSPTLFNAGRNNGCTLSACFVFDIADSMFGPNSIVETRAKAIAVAKAGGGVGYYGGHLRPKGSLISTIQRVACGPIAVLRDKHAISKLITQGGKRELAQMWVQPCWHQDVCEFIHCKDEDPQGLGSFNISVGWTDEWVKRILPTDNGMYRGGPEQSLWQEQCQSAWKHGCPGMFFPGTVNRFNFNKHLGLINAPNPCGETPNRNNEPCNLGSLVLSRYFLSGNRSVDWRALEEDVWTATEFLDDILDHNVFPHPDITEAALLTRKLGLGAMAWADLLALCHIHYDSEEALTLADKVASLIEQVSHAASDRLAYTKEPYKGFSDKTEHPMRRNETTTSIAPTGTIGIIAGVKGFSIEPWFAAVNERTTHEGIRMVEDVPEWMREHLDGFVPHCAHEIAPEWHVRHQAAWQKHVDLGVSKTVNLPNSATVEDVSRVYRQMYETGCKGGTIFREGCRDEQVLVRKKTGSVYSLGGIPQSGGNGNHGDVKTPAEPVIATVERGEFERTINRLQKRSRPKVREGVVHEATVGGTRLFFIMSKYPDGAPMELFICVAKIGSSMAGMLDSWAISFSQGLQHGIALEVMCRNHVGTRFEPAGLTDNPEIPVATSIPDYVCRWLLKRFHGESTNGVSGSARSGQLCPDCGVELLYVSGCLSCPQDGCGWTRCG